MLIICTNEEFANLVLECFCHNGDEEHRKQCPFYGACNCDKTLGIVEICRVINDGKIKDRGTENEKG